LKRYDEAFGAYDKALAIRADLVEAWLACGGLFARLQRIDDALGAYDRALTISPGLAEAWLGRGEALQQLRPEEAIVAYRRALAEGGDPETIQYALASLGAEAAPVTAPKVIIT